jgi:hypothetical protein
MLSELLDVMREHGWSETGPDHDPVRWLKEHIEWLEGRASDAEREAESVQSELARREDESDAYAEAQREIKRIKLAVELLASEVAA